MLENWCNPVRLESIKTFENLDSLQFGKSILIHTEHGVPDLREVQMAIVGTGAPETDQIRNELYTMSGELYGVTVVDLGDLKRSDSNFVIPVLHELLDAGIIPILIGDDKAHIDTQYKAYLKKDEEFRMALIDSVGGRLDNSRSKDSIIFDVLNRVGTSLVDFGLLGYQSHLIHTEVLRDLRHRKFSLMRLAKAQEDIEETEPFLRNMNAVAFSLSALRFSEAPGQRQNYPSGFFSEEACQLARYAGISDHVTSFGIYGFIAGIEPTRVTQTMVAQLIWYFIEGVSHRYGEFPERLTQKQEYLVELSALDSPLTFVKSLKSGRWWMKYQIDDDPSDQYIPCSPTDYESASKNQLPDRLFQHLVR